MNDKKLNPETIALITKARQGGYSKLSFRLLIEKQELPEKKIALECVFRSKFGEEKPVYFIWRIPRWGLLGHFRELLVSELAKANVPFEMTNRRTILTVDRWNIVRFMSDQSEDELNERIFRGINRLQYDIIEL